MLTNNQIYSEAQAQAQDTSTATLTLLQRAINQGMRKFIAVLSREWITTERTFDVKATQQYYQMPEDCTRITSIVVTMGNINYPLEEIPDEGTWHEINMRTQSSSYPRYYYVKGNDQYGIWPKPSADLLGGGTLHFEQKPRDMSQADYITGTVSLVNGSAAVVGTSTIFTSFMVGRKLILTDGSPDGTGYTISGFTDTTHITLENYYGGSTNGSATFIIGEVPNIPEEFHESLIDYALYRFYRRRKDVNSASAMKSSFDEALTLCEQNYSSKTTSQYVKPIRPRAGYYHYRRDLTIP